MKKLYLFINVNMYIYIITFLIWDDTFHYQSVANNIYEVMDMIAENNAWKAWCITNVYREELILPNDD